jgi:hypothetical protein
MEMLFMQQKFRAPFLLRAHRKKKVRENRKRVGGLKIDGRVFCEICEPMTSFTKNCNLARHIRDNHTLPQMVESGLPLRHLFLLPRYSDKLRQFDALSNPVTDTEWHMQHQDIPKQMVDASTMVGTSGIGD